MAEARWIEACFKLRNTLEERNVQVSMNIDGFEGFESALTRIYEKYSQTNATSVIQTRLAPLFGQLKLFAGAVARLAPEATAISLLWAGNLAMIQSLCRFSSHIDSIIRSMIALYQAMPDFDITLTIDANEAKLSALYVEMYLDFTSFCKDILKWSNQKAFIGAVKGLFAPSLQQHAQNRVASMTMHNQALKQEALLVTRKAMMSGYAATESIPKTTGKSPYVVPGRRDTSFCGRGTILQTIHNCFTAAKTSPTAEAPSVLIHGLSGMGKTSTALEYTYRYRESYDFIFWVVAETKSDLVRSYAQVIAKLRAFGYITSSGIGSDEAKDWFEATEKRWLLVLDNVEDWNNISQYWPANAKSQSAILVTAQKQEFRDLTTQNILLEDLSDDEGVELLLSHSNRYPNSEISQEREEHDREVQAARKVTHMFGGLPLAIAHIAGYVSDASCTLCDFLEITEQRYSFIWDADVSYSKAQYKKRLNVVWDFALDELPEEGKDLIYVMAFMNPDSMPEAIFLSESSHDGSDSTRRKAKFIEMMRCVVKRALVRPIAEGQGLYSMHRALQKAILYKLDKDPERRQEVFLAAFRAIRFITPSASPIQVPNPKLWDRFELAVPQILAMESAVRQSEPSMKGTVEFAQLLYDAAFNTWERESSQDGLRLLETAQAVLDELEYDPDAKLRADILIMRGVICDNIGISQRKEALQVRKVAVGVRQMVVTGSGDATDQSGDILLHNALNDTAESHLQYYEYSQASHLIEICRKRYQVWGTEEQYPFEYGKYYRNKALVYTLQGRFQDAITAAKRSVELAELDTGIGPRYLLYLQDVASHILQSGDYQGALKQHQEVLKLREKHCGKHHDVTLQSAYAVGAMYFHLGNMEEAESWFRETLRRAKRTQWPEEPLCRTQYHLALVIRLQSPGKDGAQRMKEASELEQKAKEVLYRLLAYDWPEYLKQVDDELILFDHLQPCFRGRWTGIRLLRCIPQT